MIINTHRNNTSLIACQPEGAQRGGPGKVRDAAAQGQAARAAFQDAGVSACHVLCSPSCARPCICLSPRPFESHGAQKPIIGRTYYKSNQEPVSVGPALRPASHPPRWSWESDFSGSLGAVAVLISVQNGNTGDVKVVNSYH